MKIVLATHLYPPDIAQPAPYVKELARRLSQQHTVTVVSLGMLPEIIAGVVHVPVSKSDILPVRVFKTFLAFLKVANKNDVCIVENGAAIALPALLALFFVRTPIILHEGDMHAKQLTEDSTSLRWIDALIKHRSLRTVSHLPIRHPEKHRFNQSYSEELVAYERSWTDHLELLNENMNYVAK